MSKSSRLALTCMALWACLSADGLGSERDSPAAFDPAQRAAAHAIQCNKPATSFFEGGILGNGAMGAVVCSRPDAVVIHFGHNEVWDIRLEEPSMEKLGTFDEVWRRIRSIQGDPAENSWFREYCRMAHEPYSKPYPRPWPCGTLLLGFDRRSAELLGHRVRIEDGVCEVGLQIGGRRARLEVFAEMKQDRLWLRLTSDAGEPIAAPFNRVLLIPQSGRPAPMLRGGDTISYRQVLSPLKPDPAKDQALRMTARVPGVVRDVNRPETPNFQPAASPFVAVVGLDHGLASAIPAGIAQLPRPDPSTAAAALASVQDSWKTYWSRSGVLLADPDLERIWYRNLYFFNCVLRPGVKCPGLFGNWSCGKIGSSWHGDYHHNYNLQQPFWVAFSSNHVDKHEPYIDLVHFLLPMSRRWAKEYYHLPGACFPHSSYPVEMTVNPYPVPTWGWEICETPWTVQSLWWHYRYTMDARLLRERLFEPIRDAVRFLNAYMRRPEAHGPASPFKDDRFHVYPTVPPELYGMRADPRFNADCLVDVTLTRFVLRAYLDACRALGVADQEAALMKDVNEILAHLPEYSTAASPLGRVFLDVAGSTPETIYNTPNPSMVVFPGEEIGLGSPRGQYELAKNTWRNQRNEGGNDLVFQNLQGARLGLLDLDQFKRQVRYCTLPNGTATDMALEVGGRYTEGADFGYMANMGIWVENFALPAVINECLVQGYDGQLRLFPGWPRNKEARFQTLRIAGAFLVSAELKTGRVAWVQVTSEAGQPLRLVNPWRGAMLVDRGGKTESRSGSELTLDTRPGETLLLRPAH